MTKLRPRPATRYHAFLIQPLAGFVPKNWQDKPKHYRILEFVGSKQSLGKADAWRFMHNHLALQNGNFETWAIYVE